MSGSAQKRLQGKDRLVRVHRIRTLALAALAGVTALLVVAGFVAQEASLKPLFLPLSGAFEIGLLMALVATGLAGYFRRLEIAHAASDSQRFLLAKEGMGRAGWAAGLTLAVGVILLLPMSAAVSGDLLTEPPLPVGLPGFGTQLVNFTDPDAFGLGYVRQITVTGQPSSVGNVRVTVVRDALTVAAGWVNDSERLVLPFDETTANRFASWSIALENTVGGRADLAVVVVKAPMAGLLRVVPLLLLLLGAANVGWWVLVRPIRERTRSAAVYAGGIETRAEQDERFYVEYATAPAPRDVAPVQAPPTPTASRPSSARTAQATPALPAELPRPSAPIKTPVKAPKFKPETPEGLVTKADVLLSARQHEAALAAFDEALRLNPSHVPALLGRATCVERLEKRPEAIEAYRRVLAADRTSEAALAGLAGLLIQERRWRESLEIVEESLRRRPHDGRSLERKGDILTNLGRRAEALGAYDAAAALDPTDENLRQKIEEVRVDVPGLLSRALIASASGNYAQALKLFDDILDIDPGNVNALIGTSIAYRRSGKSLESLNCLDLVLSIQPNNAAALLNRGHILEAQGDLDGALESYDKLVSVSTLDDEAWAAQGDILAKMGRDDDAVRAYAEALKLNPGDDLIQAKVRELEESRAVHADIMQQLYEVKGVGPAKAKALVDAGFRGAEDFALATVDELMAVKGVTKRIAQDLIAHFSDVVVPAAAR